MKYYKFEPDVNGFDGLKASAQVDKVLKTIKGVPLAETWKSLPVQLDDVTGVMGDFPGLAGFSNIPVFSQRAWEALEALVGPHVEALPLRYKSSPFFAINVLAIEDCLDEEKTEFGRLSNNKIYCVEKYVFKRDFTPQSPIFWVKQVQDEVLVSDAFRKEVKKNGLTGLEWFALK